MPLPAGQTCDLPTEVCCTSVYDVAFELAGVVFEAVEACGGIDTCKDMAVFVSHGEPSFTNGGDYVAAWLASMTPAAGSANRSPGLPRPRATFGIKIMESGFPTLTAEPDITVPDVERIHILSMHSLAHAERAARAVYTAARQGRIGVQGGFLSIDQLRPTPRTGGLVGWTFGVTVDLEWSAISAPLV